MIQYMIEEFRKIRYIRKGHFIASCFRFNNGWTFILGIGLHIFKSHGGQFSLGRNNQLIRSCHKTTIDIKRENTN